MSGNEDDSILDLQDGDKLVVAEDLCQKLGEKLGRELQVLGSFKGSALEGVRYVNPLAEQEPALDRVSPVVIGGDYITTEAGTGLVHTAPGHGHEDFQVRSFFCKSLPMRILHLKLTHTWLCVRDSTYLSNFH